MEWQNLLKGVTSAANDIAGVWSNVQQTRTNIATTKATAEIERAAVETNRAIALANLSAVKADRVAPAAAPLPPTVINTATGLSPGILLAGAAALVGGFFLLTRKG